MALLFCALLTGDVCADQEVQEQSTLFTMQGSIMSVDLERGILIANERTFDLSAGFEVFDHEMTPQRPEALEKAEYVYIKALDTGNYNFVSPTIYILPGFINPKQWHRYPFMKDDPILDKRSKPVIR